MEKPPEIKEPVHYIELQLKLGTKPTICQPLLKYPISMSVEVEAALKETSLQGQPRNVSKQKFIGECICGGPVTADEMDSEDELICYKQKGCETSWVHYINQ